MRIQDRIKKWQLQQEAADWKYPAVLFVPFAVVVVFTLGLTHQFKTFHYQDESLHYLVSLEFFRQFMSVPIGDYLSSATPMYYIVMHAVSLLTNDSIVAMRWLTMLTSYAAILVVMLLFRSTRNDSTNTILATFVYALSPYVFGSSFILLNDNMALAFLMGAVLVADRNVNDDRRGVWLSCMLVGCAVMTRQNYIWVYALIFAIEVSTGRYKNRITEKLSAAVVSLLPTLILFVMWGGVTTPSHQSHHVAQGLNWRALLLTLVLLGFYSSFLFPWKAWKQVLTSLRSSRWSSIGIFLGIALTLLGIWTLGLSKGVYGSDGFVLSGLRYTPYLGKSSVAVYLLIVPGVVAVYAIYARRGWAYLFVLVAFVATMLPSIMMFQKYYDYMLLFWLLYGLGREQRLNVPGCVALLAAFALYHISYQMMF